MLHDCALAGDDVVVFDFPLTVRPARMLSDKFPVRGAASNVSFGVHKNVSIRRRPGRFLFAFGRPDVLAARRAERCAKWEWSEEFLNKARPDKFGVGNYGAGDLYDDGLTRLERNQMASGREGFLTGAAKLRYRRLTGQIQDADAEGLTDEIQNSVGKGNSFIDVPFR